MEVKVLVLQLLCCSIASCRAGDDVDELLKLTHDVRADLDKESDNVPAFEYIPESGHKADSGELITTSAEGEGSTGGIEGKEEAPADLQKEQELAVEATKKKVPLREILLSLKPASLMDDEEREAAVAAGKIDQTEGISAGSVRDASLGMAAKQSKEEETGAGKVGGGSKKVACLPTATEEVVQLLNSTGLQALVSPNPNSSSRAVPAPCQLVLFYSPHCPFSVAAAPAITALAKELRGVMPVYGVDSVAHHSINAQYGVMGTPLLLLFHGSHSVAQYNASTYTPALLTDFLHHFTDVKLEAEFNVTSADVEESVLPVVAAPAGRLWLVCSWLFLLGCACYCFLRSSLCRAMVEAVLHSWREAEAQHHHQD